ncbi:hypothetical protein Q9R29_11920 [Rothia sp. ARF10]|nr:hypothetical protein [Rothia sp. ARF10]
MTLPSTRARRALRTLGLAAGLLSVVLGATACSSDDPAPSPAASRTTDDAAANDALYTCLMDAGFAVTRGVGGAIEFKDPEDTQGASYTAARSQCLRDLEADGTVVAAAGTGLAAQYAAMTRLHACLTRKGVAMEAWPTEAVFVEKDGAFNVLSAAEEVTMERAAGLCPDEVAKLEAQ